MTYSQPFEEKGQAMTEMLLALPLLLLMAAATTQFSVLFISRVQFEHACGESARKFAAGLLERKDLARVIQDSLLRSSAPFVPGSVQVFEGEGTHARRISDLGDPEGISLIEKMQHAAKLPLTFLADYGGGQWTATVRIQPPSFFRPLFPEGVPLESRFSVFRHPLEAVP